MMQKQIYDKMLRKPALWTGPCPMCGKQIRAGDLIRQPFARGGNGCNRFGDYWMCYSCAGRRHIGWRSDAPPRERSRRVTTH